MKNIFKKIKFYFFFNTLSISTNLLYKIHFFLSNLNFLFKKNFFTNYFLNDINFLNEINFLNKNLYCLLKNVYTTPNKEEIISEISSCYQNDKNLLRKSSSAKDSYSTTILDPSKIKPNILNKIIPIKVINFLKNYFNSNVKIYSMHIYRTTPDVNYINPSFLWHFDNVPFYSVKCMILLTDTDSTNGAMKIMSGKISKKAISNKFYDRYLHSTVIDENISKFNYEYASGSAGDAFFFHNGRCLHKAINPLLKSRTVIVIDFVPSFCKIDDNKILEYSHFYNAGIYVNPFTNKKQETLI